MSRKILITGFGPFGAHPQNPTEVCLREFAKECNDRKIKVLILPVEYDTASDLLDHALDQHGPEVVLMFGLSAQATRFRLEKFARNRVSNSVPDVSGFVPKANNIIGEAADSYGTNVDLHRLSDHLQTSEFEFEISTDAGDYLCNYLYFQTLHQIFRKQLPTKALFIHSPLTKELALSDDLGQRKAIKTIPEESLQKLIEVVTKYFSKNSEPSMTTE